MFCVVGQRGQGGSRSRQAHGLRRRLRAQPIRACVHARGGVAIPARGAAVGRAARVPAAERRHTWRRGAAGAMIPPGTHRRLHQRCAIGRRRAAGRGDRRGHRPHAHAGGRWRAGAADGARARARATGGPRPRQARPARRTDEGGGGRPSGGARLQRGRVPRSTTRPRQQA
eukprot:5493568-Pleurochrysis_carterae.AAC.1